MQMQRLKGLVESVFADRVVVVADKTGAEYSFDPDELPGAARGTRVDLLITPSDEDGGFASIISIKTQKQIKPLKMASFATLVGHMLKTRDRLKATLAESVDADTQNELNEKIAWLDRGIRLFS
ncbi:MAG TPA: hypothetical protein PLM07_09440 [Candidatus Rifleibacterium sp.]|nr:hypothetical protein [Candidatus Rifleibacterium sp.]HPT46111.1 hypothetical protein [Candidatus Rifleibacterium sp.]